MIGAMMPARGCQVGGRTRHQEVVMRRFSLLLSLVTIALLGFLTLHAQPVAVAQDATPSAEEMAGLTFEPIGFAQGVALPSLADLTAARGGFEPGASFPFTPSDPEGVFVVVESGAITARVDEMSWTITRGAGASEEVAPGEDATLEVGDSAFIPGNVTGEVRNNGQERAEILVFLVSPSGGMTGEATPTP